MHCSGTHESQVGLILNAPFFFFFLKPLYSLFPGAFGALFKKTLFPGLTPLMVSLFRRYVMATATTPLCFSCFFALMYVPLLILIALPFASSM